MSRGRTVDAADTLANPCLHIVESVDFEKMGEETPTDYYYDQLKGPRRETSKSGPLSP